jgi:hypothetical protein
MARRRIVGAAAAVLVVPLLPAISATSAAAAPASSAAPSDIRELTREPATVDGVKIETPKRYQPNASTQRRTAAVAATPAVGTVRQWLGLDDTTGSAYRKDYTLRGVGNKIEVWVANDRAYPAGDCRAQIPGSTDVTDAQVADLINEFDNNMYPKETAAFSTPPDRDGSNAQLDGDYTGNGDKTVTLVDNVRDDNFYEFPANPTMIGGFFSSNFNELFDRNVMTIDAFDWAHRSGANPPDEPTDDLCTSRSARPRLYEGTFAHEWQHLLHYYTDPFEGNWINEGLSDYAQTLVGYVDGTKTVFDRGGDSHLFCFQGFGTVKTPFNANPRDCGGPENSLNLWGDGDNPNAVLADYGIAYSFMLYLHDRFGADILSKLHHDGEHQGLASLDAMLKAEGAQDMYKVIHDFQSTVLLDKLIDSQRGIVLGVDKKRVTSPSLNSTLNLANTTLNRTPGAAPNGADYVPLQGANNKPIAGKDLRSLTFEGAKTLPAQPLTWTSVTNDPDRAGNAVLFSGNDNNTNATAVLSVTVPTADPTLRFLAKYGAEVGFDYGYVVVSTDGGATYKAIAGDKTVDAPLGPGLNGTTNGFEPRTYDLSAYAGQAVLLGFQYVSDGGVNEGGLKIDDATLGGTAISDGANVAAFKSPTQVRPTPVHNWNVKLIGVNEKYSLALQLESNGKSSISLNRLQLLLMAAFPTVVAVVSYDEPTEQVQQYAPYQLKANGVRQPGS